MKNVALLVHGKFSNDRLFDLDAGRDRSLERFFFLREMIQKIQMDCHTVDRVSFHKIDVVIFHDLNSDFPVLLKILKCNPNVRLIYVPNEPSFIAPLHDERILEQFPFDRILSWNDTAVHRSQFIVKCNIGQPIISVEEIPAIPYKKKSLMGCVYANKTSKDKNSLYHERILAIIFFSTTDEGMDLYGVGWDVSNQALIQSSYKGVCERKIDVLKHYKFSICFENVKGCVGLITEKIFDCFAAGTVPVYYGAPNIQDYIPEACFIDFRKFDNYDELYIFLIKMNEKEYQAYLDATKAFIRSPSYHVFTSKCFAETVLSQIQSLKDAPLPYRSLWKFKCDIFRAVLRYPPRSVKNFLRYLRFLCKFPFAG